MASAIVCIAMLPSCHSAGEHHDHDHDHDHDHGEMADHDHDHDHDHEHEGEGGEHSDEIVFSIEKQQKFGVVVEEASYKPFSAVIRTSGEILPASGDEVTLSATTSGVFHFKGKVLSEGSPVSKGSVVAVINTQSVDGGDPGSKAKAAYEAAEKEFLRDTELLKDNIISISHYDQSKLEYEQAKAAYESLTRSGYNEGGLSVTSPLSGYLKSVYVAEGQYVSTGEPLAVVSQNRRLQLRAELSERYSAQAKNISSANFITPDGQVYSLDNLNGRLLSYGRNASDHFLPVTFELDNKAEVVPGSFVEVYLKTRSSEDCIVVPVDALVESQGVYSVYVQQEDEEDAFLKREVVLGMNDGINVQILSGLEPGDKVVVNGAIQIKLASVNTAVAGHNHQH